MILLVAIVFVAALWWRRRAVSPVARVVATLAAGVTGVVLAYIGAMLIGFAIGR